MVSRREAQLADLGAKKFTRALAERYPQLRPLVALFSECHELFGHPANGREAADLAVQTLRRGRKTCRVPESGRGCDQRFQAAGA